MSKVIVSLGYKSVVLDAAKAVAVAELVADAEVYESKWHSKSDSREPYNTHHVYPMTQDNSFFSMQLISNETYNMYKLAGKPAD